MQYYPRKALNKFVLFLGDGISSQISSKDKFLVSVMNVSDNFDDKQVLIELWKSVPKDPTKFQQQM